MAELLKDEAICLAHSKIPCDKRNNLSRECNLDINGSGSPYKNTCEYRKVIEIPSSVIENDTEKFKKSLTYKVLRATD